MDWTADLITAMLAHGVVVRDLRGTLATHPTRTYATRDPSKIRGVVVHQALSYGYGVKTVDAIARYHVSPNSHLKSGGAPGFAYTLAVDANGDVFVCQDVETATWSHGQNLIPDANSAFMGVCALGYYTYADGTGRVQRFDTPPPAQEAAIVRVWLAAKALWGWSGWSAHDARPCLLGHQDLGKPSCPGERLHSVLEAITAGRPLPALVDSATLTGRAQVAYRQACLRTLGYPLGSAGVDGKAGPATAEAIRMFQTDYHLSQSGAWSDETEAQMAMIMLAQYPRTA